MALAQGDLELLESDLAKRMLSSTVPARLAYTAKDGTPRVMLLPHTSQPSCASKNTSRTRPPRRQGNAFKLQIWGGP